MAEVILFRPGEKYSEALATHMPPLSLLYIATPLVNNGFKVKIIDTETCKDWVAELKTAIDSSTICVGISVMTGHQIKNALDFSRTVKALKPIPVIWGGLHPTFLSYQTLQNEFVDIILIGEGDKRFLGVVRSIKNNNGLNKIKGVMFKEGSEFKSTEPENEFIDLDTLPIPDYRLIDFEYYSSYQRRYLPNRYKILDLNTDRGCPYRCAFCYNIRANRRQCRGMNAEKLLATIGELKSRYGIDAINFIADNFFVNKRRVYDVCKGIIDRGFNIGWHTDIRIDTFLHYENELIELIKNSGCTALTFGVESGSDRILRSIQKDITVADVLLAHKKAMNFGFMINYHFMIGFPGETTKDIRETLSLIWALKQSKNVTIYGPAMYTPYPGTLLYDKCLELGFVPPNRLEDWIDYDWDNTSKLPWVTPNFKNYLIEVSHFGHGGRVSINKSAVRVIYNIYCKSRLWGLVHGIRAFGLDIKVILFLRKVLSSIGGE